MHQPHSPPTKKWLILAVLTLVNSTNFWQRNLLYALASVWPPDCLETCEGATFVPVCDACGDAGMDAAATESCEACQDCRLAAEAEYATGVE